MAFEGYSFPVAQIRFQPPAPVSAADPNPLRDRLHRLYYLAAQTLPFFPGELMFLFAVLGFLIQCLSSFPAVLSGPPAHLTLSPFS